MEAALRQDPDNCDYLGAICETVGLRISMGWEVLAGTDADQMLVHGSAARGLRLPSRSADTLAQLGFGLFRTGDPEGGYGLMRKAVELNPSSVRANCLAGHAANYWGSLADAEAYFRTGLALDRHHRLYGALMTGLSRICMARGDFETAIGWADRAHRAQPHQGGAYWTLVAAHAMLGRPEQARTYLEKFRAHHPGVTIERIKSGQPSQTPLTSTLEGLEMAGLG